MLITFGFAVDLSHDQDTPFRHNPARRASDAQRWTQSTESPDDQPYTGSAQRDPTGGRAGDEKTCGAARVGPPSPGVDPAESAPYAMRFY